MLLRFKCYHTYHTFTTFAAIALAHARHRYSVRSEHELAQRIGLLTACVGRLVQLFELMSPYCLAHTGLACGPVGTNCYKPEAG